MGNTPDHIQRKDDPAKRNVQQPEAPGQLKTPPGFDLKANPLQGKFDWDGISSMLAPITDWVGSLFGDEAAKGDSEKKETVPTADTTGPVVNGKPGAEPAKEAQVPAKEAGKTPETLGADPGEAVTDPASYYVADPKSAIRKNDDPTKSAGKNLPQGISVKRVRAAGTVSQVEVTSTNGLTGVAVGDKYWTSTANLKASEAVSDKTLKWVTSTQSATSAPFGKGKAVSVARDTTCHPMERITFGKNTYVLITSEDGKTTFGWVEEKHVLNAPKDRSDNFSWMGASGWDSGQEAVAATDLDAIKKNRAGVNDRTDDKTYKKTLHDGGNNGYVYSDSSRDIKLEVEGKTDIEKKVNEIIYKELMSEGSWSSMNTYDGEIFTWGRGWAATGALNLVFKELFAINPNYLTMFRQVGIDVVNGQMRVIDDKGTMMADAKGSMAASKYIKTSTQLQSFFIELGEKKEFREDIARAQYRAVMKTAGKWPPYIVDAAKGTFADNWDEAKVAMCAHLGHWLSAGSWDRVDYSATKGDMIAIQYLYITQLGRVVGTKCDDDCYVWPSKLAMYGKLGHYGNPKGDAQKQFNDKWTESREIEVKDVAPKGSKKKQNRCYIKGTNTYLKGVTLVHISGSTYRVVMPTSDMDIKKYIHTEPTAPAAEGK